MFRAGNRDSDKDSSDDDGPPLSKMSRQVSMEDEAARAQNKQKKFSVWSDVILEQELDKVGSVHVEDKSARVDRGCESFVIPERDVKDYQEQQKDHLAAKAAASVESSSADSDVTMEKPRNDIQVPIVTLSPPDDDPFGDAVDLTEVEVFGIDNKPSSSTGYVKRNPYYAGGRMWSGRVRPPTGGGRGGHAGGTGARSDDKEDGSFGDGSGDSGRGSHRGGRGRGFGPPAHRGHSGAVGQKRKYEQANQLKRFIVPEYSLESLMATEFEEDLKPEELGQQIGKALGEKDPVTVVKIVQAIGCDKALKLFELTRQRESQGGILIMDGSRRRTPGGVFIVLFKEDPSVPQDVKDQIFADAEKQDRQWKRAKRKGRRAATYEDSLKEFSQIMQQRRTSVSDTTENGNGVDVKMDVASPEHEEVKVGKSLEQRDSVRNNVEVKLEEKSAVSDASAKCGTVPVEELMGDDWD